MPGIETRQIEANGLRFETDIAGASERFALLLHGFPESKFSWRFQLPLLAELGFTAWAPNLRGYGKSSRPAQRSAYRLDRLIDDVGALIAAAKRERARREMVLIGHDWGALIAWAVAIRRAAPIDKLVVMNVPHPALFRAGLRSFDQLKRSWYIFFFQIPWLPERLLAAQGARAIGEAMRAMARDKTNFGTAELDVYRKAALEPGALVAMLDYYRANFAGATLLDISRRDQPPIDLPTLMIWGEEDTALGKALTYGTERYVRRLTMRYLCGVSHWVQQEAPLPVNAMLQAFLEDRPVPQLYEIAR